MSAKRENVNPWQWQDAMAFSQGTVAQAPSRVLWCAGQSAMDEHGAPKHAGDMRAQIEMSIDNLETVLRAAGMGLSNLVRLNIYVTDVDRFFEAHDVLAGRLSAAGCQPPGSLLGVSRLAFPELMIELEATAVET